MEIINIDKIFQPPLASHPPYPDGISLEQYATDYFSKNDVNTDLVYLPIHWTSYHHLNRENKWPELEKKYREILETYKGRKIFTVTQFSKKVPIKGNLSGCLVFGATGIGNIPIPLVCLPHPVNKKENPLYKVCFVGALGTHVVRRQLIEKYNNREDFYFGEGDLELFCNIMDDSTFCLCPRGTGKTSLRIYEALQMGCIPIYIYDDLWLPFKDLIKWEDICILVHTKEVDKIGSIVDNITSERIYEMQQNIKKYSDYFTFEGCCKTIAKILEEM